MKEKLLLMFVTILRAELQAQIDVSKTTQQRPAELEMLAGAQLPGRSDE